MTIPVWAVVGALITAVLGSGGLGAVVVAGITARSGLPAHLNAELRRLSSENESNRQRVDAVESHLVLLGDHVDLLEQHIWKELPPPPPARPIFRPTNRSDS